MSLRPSETLVSPREHRLHHLRLFLHFLGFLHEKQTPLFECLEQVFFRFDTELGRSLHNVQRIILVRVGFRSRRASASALPLPACLSFLGCLTLLPCLSLLPCQTLLMAKRGPANSDCARFLRSPRRFTYLCGLLLLGSDVAFGTTTAGCPASTGMAGSLRRVAFRRRRGRALSSPLSQAYGFSLAVAGMIVGVLIVRVRLSGPGGVWVRMFRRVTERSHFVGLSPRMFRCAAGAGEFSRDGVAPHYYMLVFTTERDTHFHLVVASTVSRLCGVEVTPRYVPGPIRLRAVSSLAHDDRLHLAGPSGDILGLNEDGGKTQRLIYGRKESLLGVVFVRLRRRLAISWLFKIGMICAAGPDYIEA